jgi:E3 ubiquitin-protein ligase HERC2
MEFLNTELIEKLFLFIPTPNNANNVGEERDRLIPNPSANSVSDMDNYYKVGMAIGQIARQYDNLPLRLPSCFWRYLVGLPISWQDYASININQFNCLKEIEKMSDDELEALQENMIVYLPNGKVFELVKGGKEVALNRCNRVFFVENIKKVLLSQLEPAFRLMRDGFRSMVPSGTVEFTTPDGLEKYVCGADFVDIEILKGITQYKNFEGNPLEHTSVKYFWNIMSEFTQAELSLYLRFVWGRSRLGASTVDTHKLSYVNDKPNHIPESHTCFFELDIFHYDSQELMKEKLLYAIKCGGIIAESDNALHLEDL